MPPCKGDFCSWG